MSMVARLSCGAAFAITLLGATSAYAGGSSESLVSGLSKPTGTYSTLHQFSGGSGGAGPFAPLTSDGSGALYGSTQLGGAICNSTSSSQGCGTLFSISPSGQISTIFDFTGPNGRGVNTKLTLVGRTLLGGTYAGGSQDLGLLFSVDTTGSNFKVLHQFSGPDGAAPVGELLRSTDGGFYGITSGGGPGYPTLSNGLLFKVLPNGFLKIVHAFTGSDGQSPNHIFMGPLGEIFGTTLFGGNDSCGPHGCGTVFSFDPASNQFTTLYRFSHDPTGYYPALGSIDDKGVLYGTTEYGGPAKSDYGTIFSMVPTQNGYVIRTLAAFDQTNGSLPLAGPTLTPQGTLLGTTQGVNQNDAPTLYLFDQKTAQKIITLHSFPGSAQTAYPYADESQPIVVPGGTIYGTTGTGGTAACFTSQGVPIPLGCGTVYVFTRPGL